jgi:uncharacterized DUF497 family protein
VEWDEENSNHLAEHGISPAEAEWVLDNRICWVKHKRVEDRWFAFGVTKGGRKLSLLFDYYDRRETIRVFTGWDATEDEITRFFESEKERNQ